MSRSSNRMAEFSKSSPRLPRSSHLRRPQGRKFARAKWSEQLSRARAARVVTDRGSVEAGAAIVAAGAWVRSLLPELAAPLRVTREVMGWFEPTDAQLFSGGRTPVFIIESPHGMHYGIPPQGSVHAGVKVAKHHHRNETVDPDAYDRTVSAA